MERLVLRRLALVALAAVSIAGCRSNLAGLPNAGSPIASDGSAKGPKLSTRTMPFDKIGSSNTVTADMPVPRPDTTPCTVTLFDHYVFKSFNNQTFKFKPPAACPGPWAKVVFNFDVRVTKGVQFDRTAIIWVDGGVVYFGTTAEPSSTLAPHWHVERDATDLSALFAQKSEGQVALGNCYCPPTYNGYQIGTATLQFYPADQKFPAPKVPDQVIGIPYSPPLGGVATLPQSPMEIQTTLPTNIVRAYLDVYLQSQNQEEQWFMCVPGEVWRKSKHALGFCQNTSFREGEVSVDGMPAGTAPIFPWIYTGGMDPYLWFPIPGVQTLQFEPYRVDLTPFAAALSSGTTQSIDVTVFKAYSYFSGAGDLLLYRDPTLSQVTGKVTMDTLSGAPGLTVDKQIGYGTGTGLFGGDTAQGTISTRSRSSYTISGYVNTSSGRITTTVDTSSLYQNKQSFNYTASKYVQLAAQTTTLETTSTTTSKRHSFSLARAYTVPARRELPDPADLERLQAADHRLSGLLGEDAGGRGQR